MRHVIAFLAHSLSAARVDIRHDHGPVMFTAWKRGVLIRDGREIPFIVATQQRELMGAWLMEYHWLRSAHTMNNRQWLELDAVARSRLVASKILNPVKEPHP